MHAQTHIHTIPTFNLYIMLKFIKNLKLIKNTNHSLTLFSPWYFDLVFAFLGGRGGGGKISPFPVLYFWCENVKNLKVGTDTKYFM